MILKRVAEAFRRQDWTAIAIEFALVVVGVLFAFQIDEWSTEREMRTEGRAATERLLAEAENTVAFFRLGVTAQRKLRQSLGYSLRHVQSGTWAQADRAKITHGLASATYMTTPNPPSSVYDDLVSSGAFGDMGDHQMRTAVAKYEATLKFHKESVEFLRQQLPRLEDSSSFQYAFNPRGPALLEIDFKKLAADPSLVEKLAKTYETQSIAMVLRERNLKRAVEMCREIGRIAGRACNVHRSEPTFD